MKFLPKQASPEELLTFVRPLYPNGIFPLGSGWQIVFYVLGGFIVAGILFYNCPLMKRRREVFAVFDILRHRFFKDGNISVLAAELSILMRRTALIHYGREKTALLSGRAWTDFLERTGADLSEEDKRLLENQAYAPPVYDSNFERGRHLLLSVRKWLEKNI